MLGFMAMVCHMVMSKKGVYFPIIKLSVFPFTVPGIIEGTCSGGRLETAEALDF